MAHDSTERFDRDTFEAALPTNRNTGAPMWKRAGVDGGEYIYTIDVFLADGTATNKRIMIRSSISSYPQRGVPG